MLRECSPPSMCYMSHVMCHVSYVKTFFSFSFGLSGEATRWIVNSAWYPVHQMLPRKVYHQPNTNILLGNVLVYFNKSFQTMSSSLNTKTINVSLKKRTSVQLLLGQMKLDIFKLEFNRANIYYVNNSQYLAVLALYIYILPKVKFN